MIVRSIMVRKKLHGLFAIGCTDERMSEELRLSLLSVKDTRRDMKLFRPTGPKNQEFLIVGGGRKAGIPNKGPTRKNKASNSNASINQFSIFKSYVLQPGSKNMAAVARQFGCSKEYVRQTIQKARDAGVLLKDDMMFTVDVHEAALRLEYGQE